MVTNIDRCICAAFLKKIIHSCLVLLFIVLSVSGCRHASGPPFELVKQDDPGKAIIYVYRPQISSRDAADPDFNYLYADGEKKVRMQIEGYTRLLLEPGKHELQVRRMLFFFIPGYALGNVIAFNAEAEREYFFSFQWNVVSRLPKIYDTRFNMVSKEIALPQLQQTYFMKSP